MDEYAIVVVLFLDARLPFPFIAQGEGRLQLSALMEAGAHFRLVGVRQGWGSLLFPSCRRSYHCSARPAREAGRGALMARLPSSRSGRLGALLSAGEIALTCPESYGW